MNEHRGATESRRCQSARAGTAALSLMPLVLLASCGNPFGPEPGDYGPQTPTERLRTVTTLRLEDHAKRVPPIDPDEESMVKPPLDPFAGMKRYKLNIEEARAWTLSNNLDLQVALIDPTIQSVRLSEEEAKFESVFTTRVRYSRTDQPSASALDDNQAEQFTLIPGVRIPLRTGGSALVELPVDYLETSNAFSLDEQYQTDLRLSLSQPLLRNAGRRTNTYSIRIQALESQIAEARAKLEIIRQLANVDRAYWRLFAAQRLLEVRQNQYELAQTQLSQAERRVRAQLAPQVEVIRAQSGLAERLEGIIIAENLVRNFQRDLKRILNQTGLEISTDIYLELLTEPDPIELEMDAKRFADAAVSNRMEMLELELRLAQDYSTIDFQRNQALPLFTVDYSYNVNGLGTDFGGSLTTLRENEFEDWSVGANFEVPLGNEAGEARVHRAILTRLQRLSTKDARELAIRQEVLNAIDRIDEGWQRILAARQSVVLAARTLRAEQNQFDVGARTSTDVLDAATRLADAQQSEISALTEYQIAQVDLAFATGTLLGATKVDWEPRDPRQPGDFVGERRGRVPLGPPGILPTSIEPRGESTIQLEPAPNTLPPESIPTPTEQDQNP